MFFIKEIIFVKISFNKPIYIIVNKFPYILIVFKDIYRERIKTTTEKEIKKA
jgi:hypothetical protein